MHLRLRELLSNSHITRKYFKLGALFINLKGKDFEEPCVCWGFVESQTSDTGKHLNCSSLMALFYRWTNWGLEVYTITQQEAETSLAPVSSEQHSRKEDGVGIVSAGLNWFAVSRQVNYHYGRTSRSGGQVFPPQLSEQQFVFAGVFLTWLRCHRPLTLLVQKVFSQGASLPLSLALSFCSFLPSSPWLALYSPSSDFLNIPRWQVIS